MHAGKVPIEGGGTEAVVAENLLYGGQRGLPFCRAIVAKVCLKNVRCYVLGDAGALGDPFDDLLYRVRTNDPALIQREVRNRSGIGPNPDRSRGRVGGVSLDCTFLRGYAKNPYLESV
jgi:hypothetical protein